MMGKCIKCRHIKKGPDTQGFFRCQKRDCGMFGMIASGAFLTEMAHPCFAPKEKKKVTYYAYVVAAKFEDRFILELKSENGEVFSSDFGKKHALKVNKDGKLYIEVEE